MRAVPFAEPGQAAQHVGQIERVRGLAHENLGRKGMQSASEWVNALGELRLAPKLRQQMDGCELRAGIREDLRAADDRLRGLLAQHLQVARDESMLFAEVLGLGTNLREEVLAL